MEYQLIYESFGTSAQNLLDVLRRQVDDPMLLKIAQADYGYQADENFQVLRTIRDTGIVPSPLNYGQREVLQLTQWHDPRSSTWNAASDHIVRAFACAVLLTAATDSANQDYTEGENSTLAQFLVSVLHLSIATQEAALQFFAWRMGTIQYGEERAFFAFALFFLIIVLHHQQLTEAELLALCDWLEHEEVKERQYLDFFVPDNGGQFWLLGLSFFTTGHDSWLTIAKTLLAQQPNIAFPSVQARIQKIAHAMLEYHI